MKIADKFVVPMEYTHFGYTFLENMGDGLHLGIDLNWGKPWDDLGKQVSATAAGVVVYSKNSKGKRGWGNLIVIEHLLEGGDKIYSRYGHLKERWIAEGQEVDCGQGIGTCGTTGNSTAPHLHWDMFVEKFLKDGNSLTAYPQRWSARRLRAYFFDPLLFVKNFAKSVEEEECRKQLLKYKGELHSLKQGLEEIADKLSSLPGEHKVEPTIASISGEIDGWLELESEMEKWKEKAISAARENEERLRKWSQALGIPLKSEEALFTAFSEAIKFREEHKNEEKVWRRREKELLDKIKELKAGKGGEEKWPRLLIRAIKRFCGDLRESLSSPFSAE